MWRNNVLEASIEKDGGIPARRPHSDKNVKAMGRYLEGCINLDESCMCFGVIWLLVRMLHQGNLLERSADFLIIM